MVAQIDKQQIAVVALAVHPAGEFHRLADVLRGELVAGMGSVGMHIDQWFYEQEDVYKGYGAEFQENPQLAALRRLLSATALTI